jgi:ribosomal-protein-alanine N-acetyltransferase
MLEGRIVNLRLFSAADLEPVSQLEQRLADRGEFFPIGLRSLITRRKDFEEHGWWQDDMGRMLITSKDDRILGDIGFFGGAQHHAGHEIGYQIYAPSERGKGLMSAALRIFSAYLFELKPIPRLQVLTLTGNAASQRVAEKCGYQREGVLRRLAFHRGDYRDCIVLSLLREECCTLQEALEA